MLTVNDCCRCWCILVGVLLTALVVVGGVLLWFIAVGGLLSLELMVTLPQTEWKYWQPEPHTGNNK